MNKVELYIITDPFGAIYYMSKFKDQLENIILNYQEKVPFTLRIVKLVEENE